MDDRLFELISELSDPTRRAEVVGQVATKLGGRALLVFVKDTELGVLVPAPGLPQTVPGGPSWRALLAHATVGIKREEVAFPDLAHIQPATSIRDATGIVAVLVGVWLDDPALDDFRRTLPLLAAMFRAEQ